MSGGGVVVRVLVVVTWAAVMSVLVETTEVTCGDECSCDNQQGYQVLCHNLTHQEVTLTEAVFPKEDPRFYHPWRNQVEVQTSTGTLVRLTEGFITRWKSYIQCSLSVSGGHLLLPETSVNVTHDARDHPFSEGSVLLDNVIVDVIPGGLFSGKYKASLQLTGCWVRRLAHSLMDQVNFLQFIHIENCTMEVFEGHLSSEMLRASATNSNTPVKLVGSTFGVLATGAISLYTKKQDVVLEEVTIVKMATGALQVQGKGKLVMSRCRVVDFHQNALNLQGDVSAYITNSSLMVRPGALSQMNCSFHHIDSNNVLFLPAISELDNSNDLYNSNDTIHSEPEPETSIHKLEESLHSTCIERNLPAWLPTTVLFPKKPFSFEVMFMIAMVLLVVLVCLLGYSNRHYCTTCNNKKQEELSQQAEDPIYEEPRCFSVMVPPVPLISTHLAETCDKMTDDSFPGCSDNYYSTYKLPKDTAEESGYLNILKPETWPPRPQVEL